MEMTFPFAPLEKYAWPGGYEIFAVTTDGDILCADCVNDPTNPITSAMCDFPDWSDSGWNIEGIDTSEGFEMDEIETCAHCGNTIG